MTNSHGYVLEYPRIRVDHFEQAAVPLPASLLAHRRSVGAPVGNDLERTHFQSPLLYLLTHIHTDHLKGLDRPGITAPIYCSLVTKNLLLRYERQTTRIEKDRHSDVQDNQGVIRPYAHLYVSEKHASAKSRHAGYKASPLDLLRPLPYNTPTKIQYTPKTSVTLTLIESNHMLGGTMFLIQGDNGAVLHTGDLRAEAWWCEALLRNPVLSQYVSWSSQEETSSGTGWADHVESLGSASVASSADHHDSIEPSPSQFSQSLSAPPKRTTSLHLENIYLDTELLFCNQQVPSKQQACQDLIALMKLYPNDTVFFLNAWTWGYEDMLIAAAKAFGCKIHVDRFKLGMYKAARSENPFLSEVVTSDGSKTRFHACEKRNMCPQLCELAATNSAPAAALSISHSGSMDASEEAQGWGPPRTQSTPLFVYVNPGQVSLEQWPIMFADTTARLRAAERGRTAWPEILIVPIERHSTLPELQNFVKLFRPRTVSPNTILDPKGGLDYYLLHHLFGHLLHSAADRVKLARDGLALLGDKTWAFYEAQIALARQDARADAGESTEAHHGRSSSWNGSAHSSEGSLEAAQLDRLCKIRGLSFKGVIMHNMAGRIAAMLEVERWARVEPDKDIGHDVAEARNELQESLSSGMGTSVSSANYDADHSQYAETQVPERSKKANIEPSRDEFEDGRLISAQQESAKAETQSQSQQSADSIAEASSVLTDDLARRYLNVLIHHFKVPFDRSSTEATYVGMWKTVRSKMGEQAQKVEEHWFRENGVLPPLWASQSQNVTHPLRSVHFANEPHVLTVEKPQVESISEQEADSLDENAIVAAAAVLTSFIDMLDVTSLQSENALLAPSRLDRIVALRLVLKHFRQLGFGDTLTASSSVTTSSKCFGNISRWAALQQPMTRLGTILESELSTIAKHITDSAIVSSMEPRHAAAKQQVSELVIQVTGVVLAFRALYGLLEQKPLQSLVDLLLTIVEKCKLPAAGKASEDHTRLAELACDALRNEEVPEDVLAPLEPRLLALATNAQRPLHKSAQISEDRSAKAPPSPLAIEADGSFWSRNLILAPAQAAPAAPKLQSVDVSMSEASAEDSVDSFEASSLQIRRPVPAVQPHPANPEVERRSVRQLITEHEDTAETSNGISQGSSVTQEEESTQEESQSAAATSEHSIQPPTARGSNRSSRAPVPLSSIGRLLRPPSFPPKQSLKRVHSEGVVIATTARPRLKLQRSASQQAQPARVHRPSRTRSTPSRS